MYGEHLQLFHADNPNKRLTLNAPAHPPWLAELVEAVPEALLVQTHRDPVTVMGSVNSLFSSIHRMMTDQLDARRTAAPNLDLFSTLVGRCTASRDRLTRPILDIRYDEFVADPFGTVERMHAFHGLPFGGSYAERLRTAIAERTQHRVGRHAYDLTDFGLWPEAVAERFKSYTTRYW